MDHERLSSFALISIEFDLSHTDSVGIYILKALLRILNYRPTAIGNNMPWNAPKQIWKSFTMGFCEQLPLPPNYA